MTGNVSGSASFYKNIALVIKQRLAKLRLVIKHAIKHRARHRPKRSKESVVLRSSTVFPRRHRLGSASE